MQTETIFFRAGRDDDLPAVQELCKDVWGGHDYMPSVWLEWLARTDLRIYVIEVDGKIAGFYCLGLQINEVDRAGWWQGVRVSPDFKRQGLAGRMLEHAIEESRALKLERLRYGTGEPNVAMHRVAERYGMRYVAPYSYFRAKADFQVQPRSDNSRTLRPEEFQTAWKFLESSTDWQRGEGLHCDAWTWRKIDPEMVKTRIEKGWVYGHFQNESLTALALTEQDDQPEVNGIFVTWLDGSFEGMTELTRYLGAQQPLEDESKQLEMMLYRDEVRDQFLKDLGFESDPSDWMRVFELRL